MTHARKRDGEAGAARPRWSGIDVPALTILLAVTLLVCLPGMLRSPQYSPLDEHTHVGYAYDVAHGTVPAAGSTIPPAILADWSCTGQPNVDLPDCGSDAPPPHYPASGENYNYSHPPTYYAVAGIVARALEGPLPIKFADAARVVSLVLVYLGVALTFVALRRWGVSRVIATATAALLTMVPVVLHAATIVTNDAPALIGGATALLLLARLVLDGRTGLLLPFVLTAVVSSTKVLNALPLLAVGGLLLLVAIAGPHRIGLDVTRGRLVAWFGTVVAAVAVVFVGWSMFQAGRGDPDWENPIGGVNTREVDGGPLSEWLSTAATGYNLALGSYVDVPIRSSTMTAWISVSGLIVTVAAWLALVVLPNRRPQWLIGAAAVVGLTAYPTVVQVQAYLSTSGGYFPFVSPRYGISLLPLVVAALALVLHHRRMTRTSVVLAVLGLLLVLPSVYGLSPD